jgi:regulatory protein
MAERSCHEQALRLLATRAHFRAELGAKLARRGFDAEEVAATLDRLAGRGWLDDVAAARAFVAQRQRQGLGRARLRADLQRRGASAEAIHEALAGVAEDDELARARDAAVKWRRGSRPAGPAGKAALARHLDRRGFSRRVVLAVVEEVPGAAAEDGGDGEPW